MANDKVRDETPETSRRAVMGGFVGLGVAVPFLAACGSDDSDSDATKDSGDSGGSDGGGTTSSGGIATKSEVPVGGGKIFKSDKVVLTQPTEGQFKAFSAVCTHKGCVVAEIKGADIACKCHGSSFSITDGSVVTGPAIKPLAELKVTVTGEDLAVT